MNIWIKEYSELEWGVCCVFIALVYKIHELFGKAGFRPILNDWFDDKSTMKTVVEDRRSSHRVDDYWCLYWAVHPRQGNKWWSSRSTWRSTGYARTSLLWHMGRGIRCLRIFGEFILLLNTFLWDIRAQRLYIDGHQSHGVNCLCSMLRCKWSTLVLKSRYFWLMIKARL